MRLEEGAGLNAFFGAGRYKGSDSYGTMTQEYDWVIGRNARIQTDSADELTGTIIDVRVEPASDEDEQVRIVLDTPQGELDINHQRVKLA